jgi:hypothetical protein
MASRALKPESGIPLVTEPDALVDESKIRLRAYELWQARGCPTTGSDLDDRYEAQEELKANLWH